MSLPDDKSKITTAIIDAIKEVNQTLPPDRQMSLDIHAELYGPTKLIDSLTVALLIVAVERKIEDVFHQTVALLDFSMNMDMLSSIDALADYIFSKMDKKS